MPYRLTFTRIVTAIPEAGQYRNPICIHGDLVLDQLLPELRNVFGKVEVQQHDWGWSASFKHHEEHLSAEVYTESHTRARFVIVLASRVDWPLLGRVAVDTEELEFLRDLVITALKAWKVGAVQVQHVDDEDGHLLPDAPGLKWAPPAVPTELGTKEKRRPSSFTYRGHQIDIAVTQIRNLTWTWFVMVDFKHPLNMPPDDLLQSHNAAIEAALSAARRLIEGMPPV